MLGIRHWRGIAIDLWQGQSQDFVCSSLLCLLLDEHAASPGLRVLSADKAAFPAHTLLQLEAPCRVWQQQAAMAAYGEVFAATQGRHLALAPLPLEDPQACAELAMACLQGAIASGRLAATCRRVTFLASDAATYNRLQASLFACFPEENS